MRFPMPPWSRPGCSSSAASGRRTSTSSAASPIPTCRSGRSPIRAPAMNAGGKGVLLGGYTWDGPNAYEFTAMSPAERIQVALECGAQIHPQYRSEFETGVSVAWHRVPFTLGCAGEWTRRGAARSLRRSLPDRRPDRAGGRARLLSCRPGRRARSFRRSTRSRACTAKFSRSDGTDLACAVHVKTIRRASAVCVGLAVSLRPPSAQGLSSMSRGWIFEEQGGEALFANVCAACHQPDAKGAAGAASYPALAGNKNLASAEYLESLLFNGRRAMPPLGCDDERPAGRGRDQLCARRISATTMATRFRPPTSRPHGRRRDRRLETSSSRRR